MSLLVLTKLLGKITHPLFVYMLTLLPLSLLLPMCKRFYCCM